MKNFLWISRFVRPYWRESIFNVLTNILSVVFGLFSITLIAPFLGLLFGTRELVSVKPVWTGISTQAVIDYLNYFISSLIIENGNTYALLIICILVSIMIFLKNFFRYLGMYFIAPVRNGVSMDMRDQIYQKILQLPLGFFSNERKGDLMARFTSDVQEIEWTILSSLEAIFRDPFNVIFYLVALLYMSPQLTIFIFILLPISGLIIGLLGKSLKKASARSQEKMGLLLSFVEETISGLRILKAFNAEEQVGKRFVDNNKELGQINVKIYRRRDLASPLSEFLGVMVMVSVMWFGGQLIFNGQAGLKAETFIAYIALFSQILPPVKSITQSFYNIKKGVASAERIRAILDADLAIQEDVLPSTVGEFKGSIRYIDVKFRYTETQSDWIVNTVNFEVSKGRTIAIVGQSGSGKSTLVDLLPRFYDVNEGSVTIDGIDIRRLSLKELRGLMGIVSQEPILFNDSVRNNIALGNSSASMDEVIHAAKIANAHDFIMSLENGYETNIGDRGNKLSGGQRQRLSIARAVLKNPPILILDEATSSLDTESEKLVQQALEKLMSNRTTLVIAHRLSTIQNADEIVVMQKGQIVERGNHESLMASGGVYKRLCDLQTFNS